MEKGGTKKGKETRGRKKEEIKSNKEKAMKKGREERKEGKEA